eukprot:CAMPEP_0197003076 /NCGR_PEP_ID=MMETSP1380-20130617/7446_1 /TAXON_ID=5936 /ORGANISM="Euplotes crassus, Strain CT5" /LENGTH=62 /DNA_ID=CAMNT_0042421471 /DNA_START=252 /DNA_END=440 /DNA_ORIENTATION=-
MASNTSDQEVHIMGFSILRYKSFYKDWLNVMVYGASNLAEKIKPMLSGKHRNFIRVNSYPNV